MNIKRLEIIGFKSFQDKVSFDFQRRISGIVGPNGCGKSNVVDAIRWVMGEQSSKNLRGKSMDDIIFNGSEYRKPVGLAEVSLILSAEDGRVPVKYLGYSEIQVTRRLYRDGESEYLINRTPCRLLDVAELFMDTGLGTKAYSIIEQGKIGMILHAKPEERRFLIEEAAGVTKFKSRKQMALKKIDVTRQNLLRIGDIVAEIKRQLNSLQKQAKRAEKFRAYREELKGIELQIASAKHASLVKARNDLQSELDGLSGRKVEAATNLERREVAEEEKRLTHIESEALLNGAQEELFRLRNEVSSGENKLEFQRRELTSCSRQVVRSDEELGMVTGQLANTEAELAGLKEGRETFISELGESEETLKRAELSLEQLLREEKGLSGQLDEKRRELFAALSGIAQIRNASAAAQKRLESISDYCERYNQERVALEGRLQLISARVNELVAQKAALLQEHQNLSDILSRSKLLENELRGNLEELEKRLLHDRDHLSSKSSRLHSLRELEAQLAGINAGVRSLLQDSDYKGRFAGIVADAVEVEEEYEAALEAVLADRVQYLLCRSDEDAIDSISHLKHSNGGRCSFVTSGVLSSHSAPEPDGLIKLMTKVSCKSGLDGFVEPLLAGAYLADDLSHALHLGKMFPRLSFVTLNGDTVHSGGIVSGGSDEAVQQGIIHKKREIRDLVVAVESLQKSISGMEMERDALKSSIADAENESARHLALLHAADIRQLDAEKDLKRSQEEFKEIEERILIKGMELTNLMEDQSLLQREITESAMKLTVGEDGKAKLEAELEEFQKNLDGKKGHIDTARDLLTATKIRHAALKEKHDANETALKKLETLSHDLKRRIDNQSKDQHAAREEEQRLLELIGSGELALKVLVEEFALKEKTFQEIRERHETLTASLAEDENEIKSLRLSLNGVQDAIAETSMKISEATMSIKHLEMGIQEKYRIDLATPCVESVEEFTDETARAVRQSELLKLIDDIGEVNLTAIDEYRELEERFSFLSSQKADLEDSLTSLQKAIQKINRTTRKRFVETFNTVNEKFQEVFPRLFCGGKAELRLTNEEDLLETGIDIIVQPPGKKLQNVTLLSGGEKALTAVALIFSIFMVKPSPFCLLDEVDAPLDDANINRFNDIVREMSEFAQFIIITHNKATMAVADTLFGVTMEEPGVSKIVSVRLN